MIYMYKMNIFFQPNCCLSIYQCAFLPSYDSYKQKIMQSTFGIANFHLLLQDYQ